MRRLKGKLRLRELRLEKGISQSFIAKQLGYKTSAGYHAVEVGKVAPDIFQAKILKDIFSCTYDDLFYKD